MVAVVAVHASPSIGLTEYAVFLDGHEACAMRLRARSSLAFGDFNAHATAWGSRRTNGKGRVVLECATGLDLQLINRRSSSTCIE